MGTRKDERVKGKLDVLTEAKRMAAHTRNVTNNKKFDENEDLKKDLIRRAEKIYLLCHRANRFRTDRTKEELIERRKLQNEAVKECDWLFIEVQEAKSIYHLRKKQIEFWGGMIMDLQSLIRAWRDSDADRWRKQHRNA